MRWTCFRLVPETFKFSVLTEITSRMLLDRGKSGRRVPDEFQWCRIRRS